MKRITVCCCLVLFLGCTIPRLKGADFKDAKKPSRSDGKAIVYVYRVGQGDPVRIGAVMIFMDDKKVFHVRDRGFTWFLVDPGPHQFKAEWPWDEKPLFEEGHFEPRYLSLKTEPDGTYYINYKIIDDSKPAAFAESTSLLGKALSKSHIISVGLVQESEQEALSNLEGCGYQSNSLR